MMSVCNENAAEENATPCACRYAIDASGFTGEYYEIGMPFPNAYALVMF